MWQSESKHGKVYRFIGSLLVVIVGMSVITAVRGLGALWWASHWQIWAILVVGTLLMTAPFTFITLSAGPDWFQWIYRRYGGLFGRKKFIDLYDLRKIDVTPGVVTYELLLADANDSIGLPLSEWQCDRRMWDLVYNGILHSAAQGAKVNPSARVVLELDDALKDCRTPSGKQTSDDER